MTITIKKANIKGSLFLAYEFEQQDMDMKNLIRTSSDAPIHDDLRACFRKLIPHFCFISEEITNPERILEAIENPGIYLMDEELSPNPSFFKYRVAGFSIAEKGGEEILTLHGSKRLETWKEIHFSTPGTELGGDYEFSHDLQEAVDEIRREVLAYMQGKSAPKAQLEMFGEEEEEGIETGAI